MQRNGIDFANYLTLHTYSFLAVLVIQLFFNISILASDI